MVIDSVLHVFIGARGMPVVYGTPMSDCFVIRV